MDRLPHYLFAHIRELFLKTTPTSAPHPELQLGEPYYEWPKLVVLTRLGFASRRCESCFIENIRVPKDYIKAFKKTTGVKPKIPDF